VDHLSRLVPLEGRKDGLAGEHVATGAVDVNPQLVDVAEGLQVLTELTGRHFVTPPGEVADFSVKQQLADFRVVGRRPELPELTLASHRYRLSARPALEAACHRRPDASRHNIATVIPPYPETS